MSIFSEKRWEAFATGKFICAKCNEEMIFEDKWETKLICPKCGYRVASDLYGIESEEEYAALYPIIEAEPKDAEEDQKKTE